jgi:UDP-N-acetylmuramoyl-L-alanyl-D-glutamate--2,6-diaminopimelate ligase
MRLSDLVPNGGDARVTGFAIDNRKVAPGTVFGAFEGGTHNGEDFIPAAIDAGAIAVVARSAVTFEGALHIAENLHCWRQSSLRRFPIRRLLSREPTARHQP